MYAVSEDFKTQMKSSQRVEHVRGTVGNVSFTDRNIISLNYSNRCSDTSDVTFGSAYIGQLEVQFVDLLIARGAWQGKVITLEYGLVLADNTTEWVPIGSFTVAEAIWSDIGVKVTAYDNMSKLDTSFGSSSIGSVSIYDLLEFAESLTGVTNGMSQADCSALPNGTETFALYPQNDITSVRDMVSWTAQLAGGFATIDRSGNLVIRSFADSSSVDTLTASNRISGSTFSDFSTLYDGISVVDVNNGLEYYSAGGGTGGTIPLGSNPFMQYGLETTKTRTRTAIATVAHGIAYTPFNVSLLNCPVYDLGDLVTCTGGVADAETLVCCIMSIDWSFKNTISFEGYGKDPNLVSGKSKTDKALQGLSSQSNKNEVVCHTFTNGQAFTLGDEVETNIIEIDFSTVSPKVVKTLSEIDLDVTITDVSGVASCTAYYYLNDVLESYTPVTTWNNDGKHLLHLFYPLENLLSGSAYNWKVALEMDGGTATIARGDIHSLLEGQGLVAIAGWDGKLSVEDTFSPVVLGHDIVSLVDSVDSLTTQSPIPITITDIMGSVVLGHDIVSLVDSSTIAFAMVTSNLIAEDGDNLITEDNNNLVTEGT